MVLKGSPVGDAHPYEDTWCFVSILYDLLYLSVVCACTYCQIRNYHCQSSDLSKIVLPAVYVGQLVLEEGARVATRVCTFPREVFAISNYFTGPSSSMKFLFTSSIVAQLARFHCLEAQFSSAIESPTTSPFAHREALNQLNNDTMESSSSLDL